METLNPSSNASLPEVVSNLAVRPTLKLAELHLSGAGAFTRGANLGLERSYPVTQFFVLVARHRGHLLDGFKFLARNDVHCREQSFELTFHGGFRFAANALRHLAGIGHETREIVKNPIL
jgi:hypothetical protein